MSTKFEKNMEDIFELPEKIEQTKELKPVDNSDETVDNDFKYARENLYNIIERGSDALNTLVDVANQSQHPRAFEVALNGAKSMSEVVEKLAELHKKMDELEKDKPQSQINKVQNNMFVGSTAELMAMLKENDK